MIVETEAYCGVEDLAAHSKGWRRTARTEPMFGRAGTSYVFLTYGMYHCFNVVCGAVDEPVAVLIRALEPVEGVEAMRANREAAYRGKKGRGKKGRGLRDRDLCSGPAKLCQAMGIDRGLNGVDLVTDKRVWLEPRRAGWRSGRVVNTSRIGVEYAGAWAEKPLRWYVDRSEHVSVRVK